MGPRLQETGRDGGERREVSCVFQGHNILLSSRSLESRSEEDITCSSSLCLPTNTALVKTTTEIWLCTIRSVYRVML